jgi:hypothetical protein
VTAIRGLLALLVWTGVFQLVREWRYSRKHGIPIALHEKLILVSALIVWIPLQLALEAMVSSVHTVSGLALGATTGVIFNGWPIWRRLQRTDQPRI